MENKRINMFALYFLALLIYGRCGPLDSIKIVSRGVGTVSTPGKPHSENYFSPTLLIPNESSILQAHLTDRGANRYESMVDEMQ